MDKQNEFSKKAWDANAELWDSRMGTEGNDFFKILQFPTILDYLEVGKKGLQGTHILDVACGNGILARKLAGLGASVTAFDFSEKLITLARKYNNENIHYLHLDATSEDDLASLPTNKFSAVVCNMALFDISNIEPLFKVLPSLLLPGGTFIFSLLHPAFNNSSTIKMVEEYEEEGVLKNKFSLKIDKYLTEYAAKGSAIGGQKKPQYYFNRPISKYLNLGFANGFILDRFDENAFPQADSIRPLSWGGNFHEIPPVLLVRMRLLPST